jgi:hypothetical protein
LGSGTNVYETFLQSRDLKTVVLIWDGVAGYVAIRNEDISCSGGLVGFQYDFSIGCIDWAATGKLIAESKKNNTERLFTGDKVRELINEVPPDSRVWKVESESSNYERKKKRIYLNQDN